MAWSRARQASTIRCIHRHRRTDITHPPRLRLLHLLLLPAALASHQAHSTRPPRQHRRCRHLHQVQPRLLRHSPPTPTRPRLVALRPTCPPTAYLHRRPRHRYRHRPRRRRPTSTLRGPIRCDRLRRRQGGVAEQRASGRRTTIAHCSTQASRPRAMAVCSRLASVMVWNSSTCACAVLICTLARFSCGVCPRAWFFWRWCKLRHLCGKQLHPAIRQLSYSGFGGLP